MAYPQSCLIIGGGMSGLIAGTILQRHGLQVKIIDKGRGIGGRLATRRISHPVYGEGVCDYGMQFFTISDPQVHNWVDEWLQAEIIGEWCGVSERSSYRGLKSSRSIAQYLAKDLDVLTQTTAVEIRWGDAGWTVRDENNDSFHGDTLIITAPIPQTLAILDRSTIALSSEIRARLDRVTYQPCLAVLALLDKPSKIPAPGGLRLEHPSLAWIACNQQKGISPQGIAVTLHATPEFSQTHWDEDNSAIATKLLTIAAEWLGSTVVAVEVRRWLYSQPQTCYGEAYLAVEEPGLLILAGDAFSIEIAPEPSSHLERAMRSGIESANYLLGTLTRL